LKSCETGLLSKKSLRRFAVTKLLPDYKTLFLKTELFQNLMLPLFADRWPLFGVPGSQQQPTISHALSAINFFKSPYRDLKM